jgi:hypothetical protein
MISLVFGIPWIRLAPCLTGGLLSQFPIGRDGEPGMTRSPTAMKRRPLAFVPADLFVHNVPAIRTPPSLEPNFAAL